MKNRNIALLILTLILTAYCGGASGGGGDDGDGPEVFPVDFIPLADTEQNATMIQYFHWYLKNDGTLWAKIQSQAATLKNLGITAVWMPPAYKAVTFSGETNVTNYDHVGYSVYDTYDLGQFSRNGDGVKRTKYGTKQQYFNAISALHSNSIQAIADIVMNHRMGADQSESVNSIQVDSGDRNTTIDSAANRTAWTKFNFPSRGGMYNDQTMDATWFDGFDASGAIYRITGKSWDSPVSTENTNYDYLMGADLDFESGPAAQYYTDWAVWYIQHAKIDGFRLDAVKHIDYDFQRTFIDEVRSRTGISDFFVVGEYWAPDGESTINSYLDSVNGTGGSYIKRIHAFDAPLNKKFYENAGNGAGYDLRTVINGTLMNNNKFHAVTIVENHDTQPGQALDGTTATRNGNWIKQIAYATALLRQEGYPCVFYADLYGCDINGDGDFDDTISGIGFMGKEAKEFPPTPKLNKLLEARKLFAYGNQRIIGAGLNGENADTPDTVAWIRGGISSKPKSGCLVMISDNGLGGSRTIKFYESSTLVDNRFKNTTFIDYLGNTSTEVTTDGNGIGTFPYPPGSEAYVWVLK